MNEEWLCLKLAAYSGRFSLSGSLLEAGIFNQASLCKPQTTLKSMDI